MAPMPDKGSHDGLAMTAGFEIRAMTSADMAITLGWARTEGWNPGHDDAVLFRTADPAGFLMASADGQPAASISVVRYGSSYGFLGLYIAAPAFRGRGIGWQLWQAGMAHLEGRVVGLDGVVAQQANYAKSGFAIAHRNIRFQGVPFQVKPVPDDCEAKAITADQLSAIRDYDLACFGAARDAFLMPWLSTHTARALLRDGRVAGYGVIRPCAIGHKIGPLFADDAAAAETLFQALVETAPGESITLDCPEPNKAACKLAKRHGLQPVFETARMYRGADPRLPLDRIFGITTFELG
jgi:GNAT superfamily N-acetyltransferase